MKSKIALLVIILSSVSLTSFVSTAHATETGSIRVCKAVLNAGGQVVVGNSGTTFTIPWLSSASYEGIAVGVPSTETVFNTPLSLNTHLNIAVAGNNARCEVYSNIPVGRYYYGEEIISSLGNWSAPRYYDEFTGPLSSLSQAQTFNSNLDAANDDFDGVINITSGQTRTLVVVNQSTDTDLCPNIAGLQSVVPSGKHIDNQGNCVNDEVPATGSIKICKIVLDSDGDDYAGNSGSTFTVPFANAVYEGAATAVPASVTFDTPLAPLQTIFGDVKGECQTVTNLAFGRYYYGEENVSPSSDWETPLYDDQISGPANNLSDFHAFNPDLDAANDDFDGVINISADHPTRILLVLNKEKEDSCDLVPESITVVSDTNTEEAGSPAVPVGGTLNSAWTASIPGATWIWGEHPVSDPTINLTETFTRDFDIEGTPTSASLMIAADNSYKVWVNGNSVCSDPTEFNYTAAGQDVCVINVGDLHTGTNTLTVEVKNWAQIGGTEATNPAGLLYKLSVDSEHCDDEETDTALIEATKIICPSEDLLPNWGNGAPSITSETATDFLDSHPTCHLEPWTFEWAPDGTTNPGDNDLGPTGDDWTTFPSGSNAVIPAGALIWVREQFMNNYIPFSSDTTAPRDNVSAEFYCNSDVLNYDNYDWIDPVVAGQVYYCIGFNVPTTDAPVCSADTELITNGGFENPVVTDPSLWDIFVSNVPGLSWLVSWINPSGAPSVANIEIQENGLNGWSASSGSQWTELDSDWGGPSSSQSGEAGSVAISQAITTINGQVYKVSFDFSARPGTDAAQNKIEVLAGGVLIGTVGPTVPGVTTAWTSHSFNFTATTTSTMITFSDAGTPNDSLGTFVDNASVKCQPNTPPIVATDDSGNDDPENDPEDVSENKSKPDETAVHRTQGQYSFNAGGVAGGEVLGESCGLYMDKFIRFGSSHNDTEQVKKLQVFLNKWMGSNLPITGVYNSATLTVLKSFQVKYASEILTPWGLKGPTGLVYLSTLRWINMLECPDLSLRIPALVNWSDNPDVPHDLVQGTSSNGPSTGQALTVPVQNEPEGEPEQAVNNQPIDVSLPAAAVQAEHSGGFWSWLKGLFGN